MAFFIKVMDCIKFANISISRIYLTFLRTIDDMFTVRAMLESNPDANSVDDSLIRF